MEIQELNDRLARLQERALTRKKSSFACDVILSPFRRLPLDILQEIAGHCHPEQEWERPQRRDGHTPSKLAATCSTWHAVIHNMPSLWQNISIDFDCDVSDTHPGTALVRISHFARLARNLPLTVHAVDEGDEDLFICIMNWIFRQWEEGSRNRLQQFIIHPYNAVNWLTAIDRVHGESFPSVQTLIITDSGDPCRIQMSVQEVHFDLPRGIFTSLGHATVDGPFSNMTHMSLGDSLDIEDWKSLLRVLPRLECGMFWLDATRPTSEIVPSFHIIPCLHHLALIFWNFSSTHILEPFINLRFPKLHILYIQFMHTPPPEFDPQPERDELSQDSFSNTFPALHTMQIHTYTRHGPGYYCGGGFTGIFHLFLAAPSLTTLAVYVLDTEDFLAIANFLREDQRRPLPNIQVFEISLEDFASVDKLTQVIAESLLGTHALPSSSTQQSNPNIDIHDSQVLASRNHLFRLACLYDIGWSF
ncbi:hypothetical protein BJ165DRAFT_1474941 [Panaeolus papilionaceus]|nr:hypothetical protein BJ165DRAFT_1474941 [Panaeolus papilionaceus]